MDKCPLRLSEEKLTQTNISLWTKKEKYIYGSDATLLNIKIKEKYSIFNEHWTETIKDHKHKIKSHVQILPGGFISSFKIQKY